MSIAKAIQEIMHAGLIGIVLFQTIFVALEVCIPEAPFKSFEIASEINISEHCNKCCQEKNPAILLQQKQYQEAWKETATKRFYVLIPLILLLNGLLFITPTRSILMGILISILVLFILALVYRPGSSSLVTILFLLALLATQLLIAKKQN